MAHRAPQEKLYTLEEYLQLPEDDGFFDELSHGRLVREPHPADRHMRIANLIGYRLMQYVEAHPGCGVAYTEGGFLLEEHPPTMRIPDVAFLSAARSPREPPDPYVHGAPDLCNEVLAPGNRRRDMAEKVAQYLAAGARAVWIVDAKRRTATIHEPGRPPRVVPEDGVLEGGTILPDLRWPLASLLTVY